MAKETSLLLVNYLQPTTEPKIPASGNKQSATETEKKATLRERIAKNRLSIFITVCALSTALIPPSCAFFFWAESIPEPYFDATLWAVHGFLISQLPMATWSIATALSTEDKLAIFSSARYTIPSSIVRAVMVALSMTSFLHWHTLFSHNPLHSKLHDASLLAWCFLAVIFLPRGRWIMVAKALVHVTVVVFFISVCLKFKYETVCRSEVVQAIDVHVE
ncbi:unnamed protein product [Clonostachys rosea]|uniref:Ferric oxidoreductase domain-containing protein n=1 Tax=Bionectria ochroleuca TaxID=29856 RepID=A0ABY6UD31_BIOOC|nr:unnamed protein product [Clonostachys rosea]